MLIRLVVLVAVLVLTLDTTADAFVWDYIYDQVNHVLANGVIKPLAEVFLGGSTGIVYNAITHNFLGIQPVVRRVWTTVLIEGGSLVISGIINVVWFVIQGIVTIIYRLVESTIEKLWELKRDIILNGIRLINSFLFSQTLNALDLSNPFAKSQGLNVATVDGINLAKTLDEDEGRGSRSTGPPVRQLIKLDLTLATLHQPDHSSSLTGGRGGLSDDLRLTLSPFHPPPRDYEVTVLRGGRSMHHGYLDLKDDFQSATRHDPMQCLPLVLCAIHADPDDLLSATEAAFRKAFRPYFGEQQPVPDWAERYVRAANTGTTAKSSDSCQKAYPSCWYSARHLRQLIALAMDAEDTNLTLPQH